MRASLITLALAFFALPVPDRMLANAAEAGGSAAIHYAADPVVLFISQVDQTVEIRVDGTAACALIRGQRCAVRLGGADADHKHALEAQMGGQLWTDSIAISECHWNWQGVKSFIFTSQAVTFDCRAERVDD